MNLSLYIKRLLAGSSLMVCAACAFVNPSLESQNVALKDQAFIVNCVKKGSSTSKTIEKVWFVKRGTKKVKTELLTLAKNEAVILGGDTIVAESAIEKGEQKFGVYLCQAPR